MLFRKILINACISVAFLPAMEQPQLPSDLIREIARLSLQSNWPDIEKKFLLQSMEEVNTQWRRVISLLPRDHFPYQYSERTVYRLEASYPCVKKSCYRNAS